MDEIIVEGFKDMVKDMIVFYPRDKRKKIEIIEAPFVDTLISKDMFTTFVSHMLKTGIYKSYMQVSEVYVYPDGDRSKKTESLMFSNQDDLGHKEILMIEIDRIGSTIKYGKETTLDSGDGAKISGRFAEMWK